MCIVLLTTAHPSYALILINNRDEFILRPTSRPHWWTPSSPGVSTEVLSSRDLHRAEQGTWLGISRTGNLAVLTNYREEHSPPATARSRGSIPAAWLGAPAHESTEEFVERLLRDDGDGRVQDVGGFSLICGKLRPRDGGKGKGLSPLAVISNRATHASHVPWIKHEADSVDTNLHVHGLSNAVYLPSSGLAPSAEEWPKVRLGKSALLSTVTTASADHWDEPRLIDALFSILDTDTLTQHPGESFDELIMRLKSSVFIPAVGDAKAAEQMERMRRSAPDTARNGTVSSAESQKDSQGTQLAEKVATTKTSQQPDHGFEAGLYGTQRQTVVLVDWNGNVKYLERALYDEWGREVERGQGDRVFEFKIDGWDEGRGGEDEAEGRR